MGWTTNREIQCGCGWKGSTGFQVVAVNHLFQWLCPKCGANLTEEAMDADVRLVLPHQDRRFFEPLFQEPPCTVFAPYIPVTKGKDDGLDEG